jgi:hypothetical protein
MRVKWWVGFITIAVAAPCGAHADNQASQFSDYWYPGKSRAQPELMRAPLAVESQSDVVASVLREPAAIRPIDTYQGRVFEATSAFGGGGHAAATAPVVPAGTPQVTAAPEMNAGLAATGLTLLFGGVAILRSRRSRANV